MIDTSRSIDEVTRGNPCERGYAGEFGIEIPSRARDEEHRSQSRNGHTSGTKKENRELKMKEEFLGKTVAFFTQGSR